VRCARLSNQGQRADRGAGAATDLERRGGENEFIDAVAGELLQVQAFDDVDAVLDEQVHVHGHGGGGNEFEGDGVRAGGESTFSTDPTGGGLAGTRAAHLRDEARGVFPVARPAGAQQNDVASAHVHIFGARRGVEVLGCDHEIDGENIGVLERRDVEENSAAEDGRDGVDRKALEPAGIGLRDLAAIVQLAMAREMAESVDMRAHVAAERQGFGGGATAGARDVFSVLLDQAEQIGRMDGVMRHAHEIGLGEVVDFCGFEESKKIRSHDYIRARQRGRLSTAKIEEA